MRLLWKFKSFLFWHPHLGGMGGWNVGVSDPFSGSHRHPDNNKIIGYAASFFPPFPGQGRRFFFLDKKKIMGKKKDGRKFFPFFPPKGGKFKWLFFWAVNFPPEKELTGKTLGGVSETRVN